MSKATKKQIKEHSLAMFRKYSDLVWYARVKPENMELLGVRTNMMRIENEYPEDVKNLMGVSSDFYHGFNSGCLASFNLILELDFDMELALENFPNLDT